MMNIWERESRRKQRERGKDIKGTDREKERNGVKKREIMKIGKRQRLKEFERHK